MNWQDLYQKIAFLDQDVSESKDKGDMDKDGKDEPDDKEYMDNKDAAIKKAMGDKDVDESLDECGPMGSPGSQPDNVSMNVSLNGSGAGGIRDLMNVLKSIEDGDHGHDHDSDMDNIALKLNTESENEAFDNEPKPDYKDTKYMTKDLAGGLNKEHEQFKREYPGDNPMAVKQLEDKLGAMYESFKNR
jgi:hypothetical protein